MRTDIIAEEFVDDADEAAEAIALAIRLSGIIRRQPDTDRLWRSEVEGSAATGGDAAATAVR